MKTEVGHRAAPVPWRPARSAAGDAIRKQRREVWSGTQCSEQRACSGLPSADRRTGNPDRGGGTRLAVRATQRGVITVEENEVLETGTEVVEGMQIDRGYLGPYFIIGANCSIPADHISPRRSALFMARSILRDIRGGARLC
ncbi:hypothetical protein DR046_22850 [Jannaschia formosa]|nr:hypothetical protein DR046_22850 [Jannaschia formosa]